MKSLYYLTINVTNRCNLFCKHCYASSGKSSEKDLEFSYIKKSVNEAKKMGLKAVLITGGEPLLRRDLNKIFKFIKSKKLKLFLATNSLLINGSNIRVIKKFVDKVNISLDGSPSVHDLIRGKIGAFREVEKKLRELKSKKILVSISFTAHNKNFNEIPFIIKFCKERNLPLNIKRFINLGRGKTNNLDLSKKNYNFIAKLVNNEKDKMDISFKDPYFSVCYFGGYGCYAGVHILSIKNNGEVWICTKVDYPVGNIKKQKLQNIVEESPILKKLRDRNNLKGKCGQCENREKCGGCRAAAYAKTGNLFTEDPICQY